MEKLITRKEAARAVLSIFTRDSKRAIRHCFSALLYCYLYGEK